MLRYIKENSLGAENYFVSTIIPLVEEFVFRPRQTGLDAEKLWTNNNSESANHILKIDLDWKPRSLCDLTQKIYETVEGQYGDIKRALYGEGKFCFVRGVQTSLH